MTDRGDAPAGGGVESAVTALLLDHGGPGAVAVVRWLVTGDHADDTTSGVIIDQGWQLSEPPDLWP